MDPDANLTELRELVAEEIRSGLESDGLDRLAELFEALDWWLSRGGFLPVDWRGDREGELAAALADARLALAVHSGARSSFDLAPGEQMAIARALDALRPASNGPARTLRDEATVWRLTAADLDAYARRPLTDDELRRFAEAIDHSSVPEALGVIGDGFSPDGVVCRHCGLAIEWGQPHLDAGDAASRWFHSEHGGVSCGSYSEDTVAAPAGADPSSAVLDDQGLYP